MKYAHISGWYIKFSSKSHTACIDPICRYKAGILDRLGDFEQVDAAHIKDPAGLVSNLHRYMHVCCWHAEMLHMCAANYAILDQDELGLLPLNCWKCLTNIIRVTSFYLLFYCKFGYVWHCSNAAQFYWIQERIYQLQKPNSQFYF